MAHVLKTDNNDKWTHHRRRRNLGPFHLIVDVRLQYPELGHQRSQGGRRGRPLLDQSFAEKRVFVPPLGMLLEPRIPKGMKDEGMRIDESSSLVLFLNVFSLLLVLIRFFPLSCFFFTFLISSFFPTFLFFFLFLFFPLYLYFRLFFISYTTDQPPPSTPFIPPLPACSMTSTAIWTSSISLPMGVTQAAKV